ncbi:MAG: cytochrome B, partial [Pseudomonadales bacterium]|nr:cytochrome B [Pseudomonadales bacterium]
MSTHSANTVKVWDPLIRVFHWSLVFFFFLAYITEDDWMTVHSYTGYCVALLVLFRMIWGFIGTRHARF